MTAYPTLSDLLGDCHPEEKPEQFSTLAEMLFQQVELTITIVSASALPQAYKDAFALSEAQLQIQRFFRIVLRFAEHVVTFYEYVGDANRSPAYYYPSELGKFFCWFLADQVDQAQLLEDHPTWIGYSRYIGNTEVEAVYETAMRYPLWQQEIQALREFFGESVFGRLLQSDPHT